MNSRTVVKTAAVFINVALFIMLGLTKFIIFYMMCMMVMVVMHKTVEGDQQLSKNKREMAAAYKWNDIFWGPVSVVGILILGIVAILFSPEKGG